MTSQPNYLLPHLARISLALFILTTTFFLSIRSDADDWYGPNFREFSGVNQAGATDKLYTDAIGWERHDLTWPSLEPKEGVWQPGVLEKCGQNVLALQKRGVTYLPMLGYTPEWAVAPGHKKDVPADVTAWTDYVTKAVRYLHAAPYKVQYFQVWNEASTKSGFWSGTMDEYMTKIHLPAAAAIHAAGGKVVYGGWPCCESIQGLIDFLDHYRAWSSIDVLDIHYFNPGDMAALRTAADARGYKNMGIWQTEIGFTKDPGYIANDYPRFLHWALTNHWNRPDKYKVFYFADWAPDDPKATWNYQHCLWSGSALNFHGVILKTLGTLMAGPSLAAFPGVTSTPALTSNLDVDAGALEAFRSANVIVIAVHLRPSDAESMSSLTINLPKTRAHIAKAERLDLAGNATNITNSLVAAGATARLTISTKDAEGSSAEKWNRETGLPRTFYIRVTLVQ